MCKKWIRRDRKVPTQHKGGIVYTGQQYTKQIYLFGEIHEQPNNSDYIEQCIRNIRDKQETNGSSPRTVDVYIEYCNEWKEVKQNGGGALTQWLKTHWDEKYIKKKPRTNHSVRMLGFTIVIFVVLQQNMQYRPSGQPARTK